MVACSEFVVIKEVAIRALGMRKHKVGHGKSHPNIAVMKYWGKSDVTRNVPSGPSISFPLNSFLTETYIEYGDCDEFYLNGEAYPMKERMKMVIELFRNKSGDARPICVRSSNNFPHGCGVASSASGFAALTLALNDFHELELSEAELSDIARFGSGSAGRSILPGIVLLDGTSVQHVDLWPEMKILSIILSGEHKKIGSTEGMIRTTDTSSFYRERMSRIGTRIVDMLQHIRKRAFEEFAELTMRESNEFHAILMETYPPIRYIGDDGFKIIEMCHVFNSDCLKVAYTFDAGPNPFLFTLEEHLDDVKNVFRDYKPFLCN